MNLKKLENATKILAKVKVLDKEITELDRFALLVTNGEIKSSFELTIEDLTKQKKERKPCEDDESESEGIMDHIFRMQYAMMNSYVQCSASREVKSNKPHTLKNSLSDNATLSILAVLLAEKQSKRTALIKRLGEYGITV